MIEKYPIVIPNLSNYDYRRKESGLSSSDLKALLVSIDAYNYQIQNPESTPAMEVGSAIHEFFLFGRGTGNVAVYQNAKTRAGKDWPAFREMNSEKTILVESELERVINAVSALKNHPTIIPLIEGPQIQKEYSFFCEKKFNGEKVVVKARPDIYDPETQTIIDLKTSSGSVDPASNEFVRTAFKYKFHLQLAFYGDVVFWTTGDRVENYVIIAVETTPPHGVAIYEFDKGVPGPSKSTIAEGRMLYELALKRFVEYNLLSGISGGNEYIYPGYAPGTHNLEFYQKGA